MTQRLSNTRQAYTLVTAAYGLLTRAGAIHAAAKVGATLKSVQGAVRHAQRLEDTDHPPNRKIRVHRRRQEARRA